ncbi:serine hydrolase domain-containing protein [Streptomyces griseomycini]|uniref:D-alanyl-D-alanine carboxypeptidase n=1 Tax=Streptomyces griseomycini TaxID=66895 RepID=A0A7W7PVZ8_9ACTN|nr:serine hydrolase domain-containing protein [Streptomyces griseomycini]MBB4902314.1 D-alanyl-D-alanine carboxypeptidase [Streptomyces griseomycini]GGQ26194.1 peptidase [Streptomyces griseomycini]GGR42062.1 peptidase [Streptomyces griseomycini]
MRVRRRTPLLAASLVLALGAGPLAAPALASPSSPAAVCTTTPSNGALCDAIEGLPDEDATAALVRLGGTEGSWRGSSGVRDLVSGRAADPNARFRAGSTTKVVTAAVVLRLAAQGEVDLDAPVERYLPGLLGPEFTVPVTVRNLLNHTSGIQPGDGWGDSFAEQYAHRHDTLSPQRVVASAVAKGPAFTAGERQQYLNVNYTVLGMLIEKVTGRPYAAEATRLVLRPAGMRHTYFPGTDPRIRGPHNRGYQAVPRPDGTTRLVDVTEWNQSDRWAAGDMISTTTDLERLVTALFGGRIVPEPQLREMFTVPADIPDATYSAGLQRWEHEGTVYWFRTGARHGYSSAIAATEDLSRTLVYSIADTDAKDTAPNPVADRILAAALM